MPAPFPITMPGVLEVWRQKEQIAPSAFAEKYRAVTIGSHRGSWDNSVTPYLTEIMDAGAQPFVEELTICGPPQSGKTNACINILIWHIYRYGGNGKFIMFPTELLAKLFYRVRLVPILSGCGPLVGRMSTEPKDTTSEKVSLRDGTHLFPAWGNSASKLSSFPADFVWADEIDKNNELTGDESDPLSLLEDRVRTARRRISLKCSSPTLESGHIWKNLQRMQARFVRQVVCPHCGSEQEMNHDNITWPGQLGLFTGGAAVKSGTATQPDFDPELMKSMRMARYAAPCCGALWDDLERNQAVRNGQWKTEDGKSLAEVYATRPRSIGFHIAGLICPDISLSDIAAEIIKARSGEESSEKRLFNSFLGLPWKPKHGAERKEEYILRLCDDRIEAEVPTGPIAAITACADMQKRGFWYTIRAWGFGLEQESWLLKHGYVDSWEALENVFFRSQFKGTDGLVYSPNLWAMDSGGGESEEYADLSRTAECYLWCIKHPGVIPMKGNSRMQQLYTKTVIDKLPGTGKALPGTVPLHNVNTRIFKNRLASKLMVEAADPGAWHLHSGLREEDVHLGHPRELGREALRHFAAQMCAERLDGVNWVNPTRKANHLWDCSVYEMALCEIAQVKFWPKPGQEEQRGRRVMSQGVRA